MKFGDLQLSDWKIIGNDSVINHIRQDVKFDPKYYNDDNYVCLIPDWFNNEDCSVHHKVWLPVFRGKLEFLDNIFKASHKNIILLYSEVEVAKQYVDNFLIRVNSLKAFA